MIKKNCTLRIKPLLVYWLHNCLSKKWLSANRQHYKKQTKTNKNILIQWPYKVQSSFFFNTLITYDS